jgi:hypothetical protein
MVVCLPGAVGLVFRHSGHFAADLRRSVTQAHEGLELCGFQSEKTQECIVLSRTERGAEFTELVDTLSAAAWTDSPGKARVARVRILRIREVGYPARGYSKCYRLSEYEGFPAEYIEEVTMDPACTFIRRYEPGYAKASHVDQRQRIAPTEKST